MGASQKRRSRRNKEQIVQNKWLSSRCMSNGGLVWDKQKADPAFWKDYWGKPDRSGCLRSGGAKVHKRPPWDRPSALSPKTARHLETRMPRRTTKG